MDLKPIASAPRDGTEFVAYRVRDNQFICARLVSGYADQNYWEDEDHMRVDLRYFTHWHDRPNRPE